jgi:DNA-directed RNA polymerase specialized sigma24 family protein
VNALCSRATKSRLPHQSHGWGAVPTRTDEELLVEVGSGSDPAFEELYGRYARSMLSLVRRLVRDSETAADVVQEVFLAVWSQGSRYQCRLGTASAFILH